VAFGPRFFTVGYNVAGIPPQKLLAPFNEREVLDLLAYLLSRGDESDAMFRGL
jgi:hypothetical protein